MSVPLKLLVIYCNPFPVDSFSYSFFLDVFKVFIEESRLLGKTVEVIDLQNDIEKEGFMPWVFPGSKVTKHLEYQIKIRQTENLVFLYPLVQNHLPASLKGFLDVVFTKDFAYKKLDSGFTRPLLGGKNLLNLIYIPNYNLGESLVWSENLKIYWQRAIFKPTGIKGKTKFLYAPEQLSKAKKLNILEKTQKIAKANYFKNQGISMF